MKSPDGEAYFPPGKESYYTKYFHAADLPSMQLKREEDGHVRFRLAILPSFTKPLFFTYSRGVDGAVIEVKRLEMNLVNNSPEHGEVELTARVRVGDWIARSLEEQVLSPEIRTPLGNLTQDQKDWIKSLDGYTWILEVSTDTSYTMEDIWSPESIGHIEPVIRKQQNIPELDLTSFIDFGDSLFRITDLKSSEMSPMELFEE
jgi:hypothetical protein